MLQRILASMARDVEVVVVDYSCQCPLHFPFLIFSFFLERFDLMWVVDDLYAVADWHETWAQLGRLVSTTSYWIGGTRNYIEFNWKKKKYLEVVPSSPFCVLAEVLSVSESENITRCILHVVRSSPTTSGEDLIIKSEDDPPRTTNEQGEQDETGSRLTSNKLLLFPVSLRKFSKTKNHSSYTDSLRLSSSRAFLWRPSNSPPPRYWYWEIGCKKKM